MMARRKKPRHNGLHTYRLRPEANNPREVAFAKQWEEEHEFHDLLCLLLRTPCDKNDPKCVDSCNGSGAYSKAILGEATERDRLIAGTVVQWLGSNCGMCFIREALSKVGKKIANQEGDGE